MLLTVMSFLVYVYMSSQWLSHIIPTATVLDEHDFYNYNRA